MKSIFFLLSLIPLLTAASPISAVRRRALEHRTFVNTTQACEQLTPGMFEEPSLIVSSSAASFSAVYGRGGVGAFTPGDISTAFSFEIPQARANQTCTLQFLFPLTTQLANSASYIFTGPGTFVVSGFHPDSCTAPDTTYRHHPPFAPYPYLAPIHMQPGNAYVIDVGPCTPGTITAGLTASNDTAFIYQQDSGTNGGCPMGAFISYS